MFFWVLYSFNNINDLVVVSELVFQDVTIGPVRLRPGQCDGVLKSAQLVQHGNLRRH